MKCAYLQKGYNSVNGNKIRINYPCGQCMRCRINRRRQWTARLLLESHSHDVNLFVTLTYSPEFLPDDLCVSKDALSKFIKRLRHHSKGKLRFYAVGEYGDKSGRPHYHLVLFGADTCTTEVIKKAWKFGMVDIRILNDKRAQYIAQYTVKKWTKSDHPDLAGRTPEFATMSTKPGIGAYAAAALALTMVSQGYTLQNANFSGDDIDPWQVRIGPKKWPLDRYMRSKILSELGGSNSTPLQPSLKAELKELTRLKAQQRDPTPDYSPELVRLERQDERRENDRQVKVRRRNATI